METQTIESLQELQSYWVLSEVFKQAKRIEKWTALTEGLNDSIKAQVSAILDFCEHQNIDLTNIDTLIQFLKSSKDPHNKKSGEHIERLKPSFNKPHPKRDPFELQEIIINSSKSVLILESDQRIIYSNLAAKDFWFERWTDLKDVYIWWNVQLFEHIERVKEIGEENSEITTLSLKWFHKMTPVKVIVRKRKNNQYVVIISNIQNKLAKYTAEKEMHEREIREDIIKRALHHVWNAITAIRSKSKNSDIIMLLEDIFIDEIDELLQTNMDDMLEKTELELVKELWLSPEIRNDIEKIFGDENVKWELILMKYMSIIAEKLKSGDLDTDTLNKIWTLKEWIEWIKELKNCFIEILWETHRMDEQIHMFRKSENTIIPQKFDLVSTVKEKVTELQLTSLDIQFMQSEPLYILESFGDFLTIIKSIFTYFAKIVPTDEDWVQINFHNSKLNDNPACKIQIRLVSKINREQIMSDLMGKLDTELWRIKSLIERQWFDFKFIMKPNNSIRITILIPKAQFSKAKIPHDIQIPFETIMATEYMKPHEKSHTSAWNIIWDINKDFKYIEEEDIHWNLLSVLDVDISYTKKMLLKIRKWVNSIRDRSEKLSIHIDDNESTVAIVFSFNPTNKSLTLLDIESESFSFASYYAEFMWNWKVSKKSLEDDSFQIIAEYTRSTVKSTN